MLFHRGGYYDWFVKKKKKLKKRQLKCVVGWLVAFQILPLLHEGVKKKKKNMKIHVKTANAKIK